MLSNKYKRKNDTKINVYVNIVMIMLRDKGWLNKKNTPGLLLLIMIFPDGKDHY